MEQKLIEWMKSNLGKILLLVKRFSKEEILPRISE